MIKLSHCIAVNDDVINTIAINCTQLAGLELTGCRDITDKSMSALASLEYLKWINLANTEVTNELLYNFHLKNSFLCRLQIQELNI